MVFMGGGQSPGKARLPAGGSSSSSSPGKLFMKAMPPLGWEGRCQHPSPSLERSMVRSSQSLYKTKTIRLVCVWRGGGGRGGCHPVILST